MGPSLPGRAAEAESLPARNSLVALLKEMATRAKLVMNKESARQSAVDMGWLTQEGRWAFMQWSPQTAQLDSLENPSPRNHEEILRDIDQMVELVNGDSVKRFSSAKTLVAEPQAEWVEFILELGIREQGHQLWDLVLRLNQCCILHPLGARFRRDRPGALGSGGVHQTVDLLSYEASLASPPPGLEPIPLLSFSGHGSASCLRLLPDACQVLLRTTLLNHDATACYMSASTLALLWSVHLTSEPRLGLLAPLFQQLKAGLAALLMRSMVWTMILGPSAQPHRHA